MATPVYDIIDAAYATSRASRPGDEASPMELVRVVERNLRGLFADAVAVNRFYYAERITVSHDAALGGWPFPAGEAVVGIEGAAGPVVEVPFDQRTIEPGKPSLYLVGRVFYSVGRAIDPAEEDLNFFVSRMPDPLPDENAVLDALWPEHYNPVLIWDLSRYLAKKSGDRPQDVVAFTEEYDREYARYIQHISRPTTTLVRDYGHGGRVATSKTVPA